MKTASLALLFAIFAAAAVAQQPRIVHGTVTSVAAGGDLGGQIRGSRTPYVGYAVPVVEGEHVMCCFEGFGNVRSGGRCSLDHGGNSFSNDDDRDPLPRANGEFAILLRVEKGEIVRVQSYSMECVLDANGSSVTWLTGVDARKSVALVASLLGRNRPESVLSTLAMHADPSATTELERLMKSTAVSDETRGTAVFWLGQTRGRRGYEDALAVATSASESPRLREKAVFALSQSKEPQALDELIALAKHDPVAHVRGQAIFWLSQAAGRKAASAVRSAVDDDPDAGVREKAVFAVSQMPDDESIPILVTLMNTHRDSGVRRKAAFWLGQKRDPRALAAIEAVLTK